MGLSRQGDQSTRKVGGCLQLPLPLRKDFQMCLCSGHGLQHSLFHQPSTRKLYQSQTLTSSTLPLSHLTLPSPSSSPCPFLSPVNTTVLEQGCIHPYVWDCKNHICFFWSSMKPSEWLSPFSIPHSDWMQDKNGFRLCKVCMKKLLLFIL